MLSLTLPLLLAAAAIAAPTTSVTSGCSLEGAVVAAGTLPAPTAPLSFISLGVGIQNYTCSAATSKYVSIGAVADIFDISCLYGQEGFNTIVDATMDAWTTSTETTFDAVAQLAPAFTVPIALGEHYFVTNPFTGTGINPRWDFIRSNPTDDTAFVTAARNAGIAAPEGAVNVDWLYLKSISGSLAQEIYRTDTRLGQAPASCVPGTSEDVQVKYVSKYWLTGANLKVAEPTD